jgi:hypothetical protein
MYWKEDEVEDYIRYPSEGSAEELGSQIYFIGQNELDQEEVMTELVDDLRRTRTTTHRSSRTVHSNTTRWKPAKSTLPIRCSASGTAR